MTVLHQDIGDVFRPVGGDTSGPFRVSGWPIMNPLILLSALPSPVRRLEDDVDILRRARVFFAGELDPRGR